MKKEEGRKDLKIVIFVGYECNNNCVFCINIDKRNLWRRSTGEIIAEIYRAKKQNADIVEFVGGETTIRKDFFTLIKAAKKLGFKEIIMATNGRTFSSRSFAEKTFETGLNHVIFSVHGHNAAAHDALTLVPGSYEQLITGIKNAQKLGFEKINGNTTVVRQNMKYLPEIGKFYLENGIRNVEFIYVDPNYGGAHNDFYKYVPKISEAAVYMRRTLDYGRKHGYDKWKVRYVPLCYFTDYLDQISEIQEVRLFHSKHWAPDFKDEDASLNRAKVGRRKTARCAGCALYGLCEGIWTCYLEKYGDRELKPVRSLTRKFQLETFPSHSSGAPRAG